MGSRRDLFGFPLSWVFLLVLTFHLKNELCHSLNPEGVALLEFRARVNSDPHGALSNWNPNDDSPCMWSGVHCHDGKVQKLNLSEFALGGVLAPEIGKLSNLRSLILYKNNFSGVIPKEIGELAKLELLDVRHNSLSGQMRAEFINLLTMKHIVLCNNNFEDGLFPELIMLCMQLEAQPGPTLFLDTQCQLHCMSRKLGMSVWKTSPRLLNANSPFTNQFKWLPLLKKSFSNGKEKSQDFLKGSSEPYPMWHVEHLLASAGRKILRASPPDTAGPRTLVEQPSDGKPIKVKPNQTSPGAFDSSYKPPSAAAPSKGAPTAPPSSSPSTSPPGIPTQEHSPDSLSNGSASKQASRKLVPAIAILGAAIILVGSIAVLCMCQRRSAATIGPWKTGLSGQLQKAFITGTPKLNRPEVEAACEDFSNIIGTLSDCTIYKGTLSNGVEIAVTSTTAISSKDWSKCSELYFRKKIDTLSGLNHKNFVNLLGYCIEEQPFTRIMVFEYAPNGTLYEHLHVKEVETLDWSARMRVIMGVAYCLQYMHDLSPPIAHPSLYSKSIYLMDDFAAKLADFGYGQETVEKMKQGGDDLDKMDWPYDNLESNIYNFGVLLLEIVSGKLPFSEEQGFLVNWAIDYLNDKQSIGYMIDPTLKSFKNNELDIICEVIQLCIHPDTNQRPTMKEITAKLREVVEISPDAATPRLSPLWWAELEILSVEAS